MVPVIPAPEHREGVLSFRVQVLLLSGPVRSAGSPGHSGPCLLINGFAASDILGAGDLRSTSASLRSAFESPRLPLAGPLRPVRMT